MLTRNISRIISICVVCFSFFTFNAQADNASKIASLFENSDFNGAVLVAKGDEVIFKQVFGIADSVTGEKLNINSGFELASISKVFSAIAIHQLVEQGKIYYDDPLSKYFPKLPYDSVTIAGLLSHTSGLFDVYEEVEMRKQYFEFYGRTDKPYGNKDYLAFLEKFNPALLAGPFELDKYSNTAYVLLGLIIEQVSGQEYDDYLDQHILKPAGMENTFVFSKMISSEIPPFVKGHKMNEEGSIIRTPAVNAPPTMRGLTYGDDDMVSTLGDLLKFDQAIRKGKLVGPVTLVNALKPMDLKSGAASKYALGFAIDKSRGKRYVGHSGSTTGFITYMQFGLSSDGHTIILLSNVRNTAASLRDKYLDIRNIVAKDDNKK